MLDPEARSEPDQQPGLSRMLWRVLRGTDPPWALTSDVVLEGVRELEEEDALRGPAF